VAGCCPSQKPLPASPGQDFSLQSFTVAGRFGAMSEATSVAFHIKIRAARLLSFTGKQLLKAVHGERILSELINAVDGTAPARMKLSAGRISVR